MATKKKRTAPVAAWPKPVIAMRDNVEKVARRTWREAVDLLPAGPRKALKQAATDFERASNDFQRRVERVRADIEARGEQLVSDVTTRAEKALTPLVQRLDVASRTDVDRLRKRIVALEKAAKQPVRPAAVA